MILAKVIELRYQNQTYTNAICQNLSNVYVYQNNIYIKEDISY